MSKYCEIKENKLVMKMEHFHPLHNLPTDDDEDNKETYKASKCIFENIVRELYLSLKHDGELCLEDDLHDIIHKEVDDYVANDTPLCEELIREAGGINETIEFYVDDWDTLNRKNLSGCLAYLILEKLMREIDNQLWEDVLRVMVEHEDGWELDFEYEW